MCDREPESTFLVCDRVAYENLTLLDKYGAQDVRTKMLEVGDAESDSKRALDPVLDRNWDWRLSKAKLSQALDD